MPRLNQNDATILAELRLVAVQHLAEARPGQDIIDLPQDICNLANRRLHLPDLRGHLPEDAMHLGIFRRRQLHQAVVHVQDIERLDKDRRPAAGMIMHDPSQQALIIWPKWNHIAIVAEGDKRLLHYFFMLVQMPIQSPPYPLSRVAELIAKLLQAWARTIFN